MILDSGLLFLGHPVYIANIRPRKHLPGYPDPIVEDFPAHDSHGNGSKIRWGGPYVVYAGIFSR